MKTPFAVLASAALLALAACGEEAHTAEPHETKPADCTGTVSYYAGSTPPPFSYEWDLAVKDNDAALFTFEAAHVGESPLYSKELPVSAEQRAALCHAAADIPNEEDMSTGGSVLSWDLTGYKNSTSNQDYYEEILDAVHDILGDSYDEAYAEFEAWQDSYEQ